MRTPPPNTHTHSPTPHPQLRYLNTWFPVGGTVWEELWNLSEAEPCLRKYITLDRLPAHSFCFALRV